MAPHGKRFDPNGRRLTADDGSAALELVLLAPVMLALIGLVIAAGRTSIAQGSVDAAARDAARQASISLGPEAAERAALSTAQAALRADGLDCRPIVLVDLAGFSAPLGQPAEVSATVRCTVPLSGLLAPGVPGSRTLTARFMSPLDPYRSRAFSFSSFEPSQTRYVNVGSPLVKPDSIAAGVAYRGVAGHALGVVRRDNLGRAGVDSAHVGGVEVIDEQPERRLAGPVHALTRESTPGPGAR